MRGVKKVAVNSAVWVIAATSSDRVVICFHTFAGELTLANTLDPALLVCDNIDHIF